MLVDNIKILKKQDNNYINKTCKENLKKKKYLKTFFVLILITLFFKIQISKKDKNLNIGNQNSEVKEIQSEGKMKTNIDSKYKLFQIKEVNEQIKKKNLTYIETLSGGTGNIGNALIMLSKLINICEEIRCKNIIVPQGNLEDIIKKPIFYKEFNITIFPNSYKSKIRVDINLRTGIIFGFPCNKSFKQRLSVIRDEVFNNIPKYNANPNDLYINIRSGDIFVNIINKNYAQPPLCFYQKIINENKYVNIYIISNGHENPVVDELLKLYPKIKFLHGSAKYDVSVIVNAYNLVMPVSTFTYTLIWLNYNLKNLYVYRDYYYGPININYTIHKLSPSQKYKEKMSKKWKNTKEQLILMLNENCSNANFTSLKYIKYKTF